MTIENTTVTAQLGCQSSPDSEHFGNLLRDEAKRLRALADQLDPSGYAQRPAVRQAEDPLNPDERPQTLLRKWADVLDIPSGDFVNSDLRAAADHIDQVEAEAWKYLQEAGRLARLLALSDTSTDRGGK